MSTEEESSSSAPSPHVHAPSSHLLNMGSIARNRSITKIMGATFVAFAVLLLFLSTEWTDGGTRPDLSITGGKDPPNDSLSVQDFPPFTDADGYWPGLRVYAPYRPVGAATSPILFYIHGGGWVRGTLDYIDPLVRGLAVQLEDFVVVSVDYRLAPATKFPGAISDCLQAYLWVVDHAWQFGGDPTKIALSGDSAGGNLAIALSMLLHPADTAPGAVSEEVAGATMRSAVCAQLFLYPVTDYAMNTPSYEEFGLGPGLTREAMQSYWRAYLTYPAVEGRLPLASPGRAPLSALSKMPVTMVLTAGNDPLRDEAENFSAQMVAAGVSATTVRYDGEKHGFCAHLARDKDFKHKLWAESVAFLRESCGLE